MSYRLSAQTLEKLGASDTWFVAGRTSDGPRLGAVVLDGITAQASVHRSIFDAVRAEILRDERSTHRIVDAVQTAIEPRLKEQFRGAHLSRTSSLREVSGKDGFVSENAYAAQERSRNAEFRLVVPRVSDALVDLLTETRRSLRTLARCDGAANALSIDPFLKGLRVTEKKRRCLATSISVLRADISGLEVQPFRMLRETVEVSAEASAKAVMANQPAEPVRFRDLLGLCVARQRVTVSLELERIRVALSLAVERRPDPADHDRAVLLESSASALLTGGREHPLRLRTFKRCMATATKAVQFLDLTKAFESLGEAVETLV